MRSKALLILLTAAAAHGSGHDRPRAPRVPDVIAAPSGTRPFLLVHARGTQNYICMPSTSGVSWTFLGPQATITDERDDQVMTHFLSGNPDEDLTPRATWQHSRDTSAVWAAAIASSSDPQFVADGAVPWLLLRVVGSEYGPGWGDRLVRTLFIQRVNTTGGVAPGTGCAGAADVGKRAFVPYTADYVFFR